MTLRIRAIPIPAVKPSSRFHRSIPSILSILSISLPLSAAPVIELDLAGALTRAPQANFQILLGQEGVAAQQQAARIARSALLPTVRLEASQARAMSPIVDPFMRSIPGVPERTFGDRFDAVLRARLALLDTRAIDNNRLARLDLAATELQVDNLVQEVLQQIAIAWFTHWRNQQRLAVVDAALERDRLLLKVATDQQQAGVATALDVTRAEVRMAGSELARLQQETAVLESALALKRILNFPLDAELRLVGDGLPPAGGPERFAPADFQRILDRRADYRQLETELDRAALAYRASRRDRLPSLQVGGEWGYAAESWSDDMHEQWAVSIGLSLPVFEGFRLDAQQRLAAVEQRRKELELEDLRQRIESDYRLLLQTLESSRRQLEVARRARELNLKEFELARIRFEEGVADNSDVVSAQAALAQAEDAVVEAEYFHARTRILLARVSGEVRELVQ